MQSRFSKHAFGFIVGSLIFGFALSEAAIPTNFTYQGSLKQNGALVNGTVTLEILITNADGTQVYWPLTPQPQSVPVKEGLYRVDIAPTNVDWANIDPYIETRVNGAKLLPREKFSATPYALITKDLAPGASAKGDFAVQGKLVTGNIELRKANPSDAQGNIITSTSSTGNQGTLTLNAYGQTNQVYLAPNGNVGIGTNSPATKLEVDGSGATIRIRDTDASGNTSGIQFHTGGLSPFSIYTNNPDGKLDFNSTLASTGWGFRFRTTPPGGTLTTMLSIPGTGNIGLGIDNPTEKLQVNGQVRIDGALARPLEGGEAKYRAALRVKGGGDASSGRLVMLQAPWTGYSTDRFYIVGEDGNGTTNFYIRGDGYYWASSSRALKQNITPLVSSLNLISQLQGVRYFWKTDKEKKRAMLGFIAEDLEKVLPDAVDQGKFVNYTAVIPVLVESIKELKARVEDLEKQLQTAKGK